jgi:protein-serine/threonine kinase
MSSIASPPSTSPYSPSPLTASTLTSASERYSVSPLPSPGASFSRWKSAFRIGKSTNVDGRPVPDPSAYGRDGPMPDAAETPPASSSRPVRAAQTRSQTDPNPLTQATQAAEGKDAVDGGRKDSSISNNRAQLGAPHTPSNHNNPQTAPQSTPTSGEQSRPYSGATDTDRSSHSSSSRLQAASTSQTSISPNAHTNGSSAASLHTNSRGPTPQTPMRSPGLGLSNFKSRFFSTPSPAGTVVDPSPRHSRSKGDKYKGVAKEPGSSSKKQSAGSSSVSSAGAASPRTPGKPKRDPSSSSNRHVTAPDATSARGSAATRFLRRVVSAPNAKALFTPNFLENAPEVPPLPPNSQMLSPIVITEPSEVDLTSLPPYNAQASPGKSTLESFTPPPHSSTASLPCRIPNGSPLNPSGISTTGTRSSRSLTASAASKPKDPRNILGVGSPGNEPHHKQVFRRTYSSNSIKTRTVGLPII